MPFETAKMLKAADYPQDGSDMYYTPAGVLHDKVALDEQFKEELPIALTDCFAAPAYCEVLDWLAEKNIDIDVYMTVDNTFFSSLWKHGKNEYYLGELPTREEAINSAIIRALEEV